MGKILLPEGAAPGTPATGYAAVYVNTSGQLCWVDDAGGVHTLAVTGTLTTPATGTVALLGATQTITGQTQMDDLRIGDANTRLYRVGDGILRQQLDSVSLATNSVLTITTNKAGRGLLFVYAADLGHICLAAVSGGTGTIIHQTSTTFGTAVDTASKVNIYADTTNTYVQNNTGSTITQLHIWCLN